MARVVPEHWMVDKRIPLASIVALVIQTMVFVWWGGGLAERVHQLESKVRDMATLSERLTKQEAVLDAVKDGVREIKDLLRPARPTRPAG